MILVSQTHGRSPEPPERQPTTGLRQLCTKMWRAVEDRHVDLPTAEREAARQLATALQRRVDAFLLPETEATPITSQREYLPSWRNLLTDLDRLVCDLEYASIRSSWRNRVGALRHDLAMLHTSVVADSFESGHCSHAGASTPAQAPTPPPLEARKAPKKALKAQRKEERRENSRRSRAATPTAMQRFAETALPLLRDLGYGAIEEARLTAFLREQVAYRCSSNPTLLAMQCVPWLSTGTQLFAQVLDSRSILAYIRDLHNVVVVAQHSLASSDSAALAAIARQFEDVYYGIEAIHTDLETLRKEVDAGLAALPKAYEPNEVDARQAKPSQGMLADWIDPQRRR